MLDKKIKILVIDDDDVDRMMIKRALKLSGFNADIFTATDIETGTSLASEEEFDCIFLDYNLPGNNGFEFLEQYKTKGGKAAIIMVTSKGDEKLAVEAMKKGANDYIPKNMITAECVSQILRYSLKLKEAEGAITKTEKVLQDTEIKLDTVIANTPLILFSIDQNGIFTLFKGREIKNLQISHEQVIGKSIYETGTMLPVQLKDYKNALFGNKVSASIELNDHFYEVHYMPVLEGNNNSIGINGVVMDITSLKKNEQELKNLLTAAEETEKVNESFLINTRNKIRNPATEILQITNNLLNTKLTADQISSLNELKKLSDNLFDISNDMAGFSKNGNIPGQSVTVEPENTNKEKLTSQNEKCTNLNFLHELSEDNDTFFKDFIQLFLENAPISLNEMETALKNKDWESVRQATHKIKPSLSYLGMKEAHQIAAQVEGYAKEQTHLEEIPSMIKKIMDTCSKAFAELKQELKEISVN